MTSFVHLHVHSEGSSLDGLGTVKDYVARAKKLGMGALALTDHGNISLTYEFYVACMEAGIDPLLGMEGYFAPNVEQAKEEKDRERFHVGLIARDEHGYEVLVNLSGAAHRQHYGKPLLDRALIESLSKEDRKHLVVLSGCAGSIISQLAMSAGVDAANDELLWWKRQFPNFYIELMHHNTEFDKKLNRRLLKLAQRQKLPWVITNDPHFVLKKEACHHDALLAIQTAAAIDDPERFRFQGEGYWLKSPREMRRTFVDAGYGAEVYRPGMAETVRVAKKCKTRIRAWDSRSWHIPKFPGVEDGDAELKKQAWAGLRRLGLSEDERYTSQLKHELKQLRENKMADFMLATADFAAEAKRRGIRMGPGRGSVAGTLVGYCIGIHKIDPVRYKLLFERFLNPERPKMPDIDSDFPRSRRWEMFEYADEKYGAENTMRVGAYQRFQTKKAFKSLAMTYGIPFKESNEISKKIIEDEDGDAVLPEEVEEAFPDLHATLMALKGIKAGVARHPAGVIIFDPNDPVRHLVPEMSVRQKNSKEVNYVSQFDLDACAGIGLLKQDFLGLRTLDTIQECVDLVKERHGVTIEPDDWVPGEEKGDSKVWKMLREGKTAGVFQMEGGANHRGIQAIQCDGFEDIVSCTSLYRAGPMIAGAPDRYIKNKQDGKIRVAHKALKPFLSNSWGELIYQEQMFEILRVVAGLSWARVDDVKTAMTKKDPEKMAAVKADALAGFQKVGGLSEEKAIEVWDMIAAQASYLFNRSHAVAYSMVTYQTARLKMLYPLEFLAALLRTVEPKNEQDKGKREAYMTEALAMGYKIMPPDVNISDGRFMPNGDDELLFGLVDISGVGEKAVEKIVVARRKKARKLRKQGKKKPKRIFENVGEVAAAVNNIGVVKFLAQSGALRSIGVEPEVAKQEELLRWQFTDHVAPFRKKYAKKTRLPRTNNGRVWIPGEIVKTERRKTKKGGEFLTWTLRHEPGLEFKVNLWEDAHEVWGLPKGTIVVVSGRWSTEWNNVSIGDSEQVQVIRRISKEKPDNAKRKKAS